MRIRKRQVPLPLSLLSPVPISDPQLLNRSPVQPDSNQTQPTDDHDYDLRLTIGAKTDSGAPQMKLRERLDFEEDQDIGREIRDQEKNNDDISKRSMPLGADDNNGSYLPQPPQILSSNEVASRWCYGDKTVPLKKRIRGSFDTARTVSTMPGPGDPATKLEEEVATAKCKVNKIWVQENGNEDDRKEEEDEEKRERKDHRTDNRGNNNNTTTIHNNNNNSSSSRSSGGGSSSTIVSTAVAVSGSKKSKIRGSTIMEGSRCSRVNGRGWRCCQPTLVGYSLCEHHLGKGRLRSVANMRTTRTKRVERSEYRVVSPTRGSGGCGGDLDGLYYNEDFDDEGKKQKQPSMMSSSKKRMKLGMVKARSISSLLGQTSGSSTTAVVASMDQDHDNGGRINI